MTPCEHPFTTKARIHSTECVACLKERADFDRKRWEDCARAYAEERAKRQELEAERALVWEDDL